MEELIQKIVREYVKILQTNLVGIYIHGSYAMGGFNPSRSDLDFLVICEQIPSFDQKKRMIRFLMDHESEAPFKGFEMSVVLKRYCLNFIYPTPYELHYSPMYLSSYQKDLEGTLLKMQGKDEDLAAHFMITYHFGICVYGMEKERLFSEVPKEAYLDSIEKDVADSKKRFKKEPVDVILNLCRVYYYKKEGVVSSKLLAGEWAIRHFPYPLNNIISKALSCYLNDQADKIDEKEGDLLFEFMEKEGILNEKV